MAVLVKNPKETRIQQVGARGITEAVLAGPGSGCNRFTVRRIKLAVEGRTSRTSPDLGIVYFIQSGKVALSHGEGDLDHLSEGDTAVIHPEEKHHLQNLHSSFSTVLAVVPQ